MSTALAILRYLFWFQGVSLVVASIQIVYWLGFERQPLFPGPYSQFFFKLFVGFLVFVLLLGLGTLLTAWGLSKGKSWARRLGIAVSVGNLIVMPPVGLFGLFVLVPRRAADRLEERAAEQEPEPTGQSPIDKWGNWIASAVILGANWAAVSLIGYWSKYLGLPSLSFFEWVGVIVVGGLISVLVHEFGHIGVAWGLGFRFDQVRVGPIWVARWPDGWRCEWDPDQMFTGGHALMIPKTTEGLRGNLGLLIAGGPLASLVFGLVCLTVYIASPGQSWMSYAEAFGLTGLFSLVDVAYNVMPLRLGSAATDGYHLFQLAQNGVEARRTLAMYSAEMSSGTSLSPRDWSPEWVRDATATERGKPADGSGCYLGYLYFLAAGNPRKAGEYLDQIISAEAQLRPSTSHGRALLLEIAYFKARHGGDANGARQRLDAAREGASVESYRLHRAVAAVALAEADYMTAENAIDEALAVLRGCERTGFIELEEELVRDLKSRVASPMVLGEWRR